MTDPLSSKQNTDQSSSISEEGKNKIGQLEEHKYTHLEKKDSEPLSQFVPKQNFENLSGGSLLEHSISSAFEAGGLTYVIQLLLSHILPFVSPPVFYSAEAGKVVRLRARLILLFSQGKEEGSPEVQQVLQELFPYMPIIKARWQEVKNKDRKHIEKFLKEINYLKSQVKTIGDLGVFIPQKRKEVIETLELLEQEASQSLQSKL